MTMTRLDATHLETLSPATETAVKEMIRRNLSTYEEAGSVLASMFRRLNDFGRVYGATGARYFVLRDDADGPVVGGAGLGGLAGLPPSEGIGEVRDLVIEKSHRGRGLGALLLRHCIGEAKALGYRRLYLETTPTMESAQKLFTRFGFRPVTPNERNVGAGGNAPVPCYYILETL